MTPNTNTEQTRTDDERELDRSIRTLGSLTAEQTAAWQEMYEADVARNTAVDRRQDAVRRYEDVCEKVRTQRERVAELAVQVARAG